MRKPEICPSCGDAEGLRATRYLTPAGFAVDIRSLPRNTVSLVVPAQQARPLVTASGTQWLAFVKGPR